MLYLVYAFTTAAEVIGIRKCTEVLNPRVAAVVAALHHHAGSSSSSAPLAPRIAPLPRLHKENLSARPQSSVSERIPLRASVIGEPETEHAQAVIRSFRDHGQIVSIQAQGGTATLPDWRRDDGLAYDGRDD